MSVDEWTAGIRLRVMPTRLASEARSVQEKLKVPSSVVFLANSEDKAPSLNSELTRGMGELSHLSTQGCSASLTARKEEQREIERERGLRGALSASASHANEADRDIVPRMLLSDRGQGLVKT